jgi:very-short-patch-repair endonuclease
MRDHTSYMRMARTQGKLEGRPDSAIEGIFAQQLRIEHAPSYLRNYVFLPDRKLELDFAWVKIKFAVEVQGAVHRITERFHGDSEKHALALLAGWTILPVTGRLIRDGRAIGWAMELLRRRSP